MIEKKRMICLDIIRIFACLCVVAVHVALKFDIGGRIGKIMQAGSSGLFVFYILSGFLIFYSIDSRKLSYWDWLKKRLIRIIPMYYFMIVVYMIFFEIIVDLFPGEKTVLCWISYFLGLQKVVNYSNSFWINIGALSSLSVFIWFYIFAPIIKKVVDSWSKSLILLGISFALYKIFNEAAWFSILSCLFFFAIGIVVYYSIISKKEKYALIVFLVIICLMLLADARGGALYGLCIGLLIMCVYDVNIGNEKIVKTISLASDCTFAIYLGHIFALSISIFTDVFGNLNDMQLAMVLLIVTIACVFVLHEIVEKGSVKLVKKVTRE